MKTKITLIIGLPGSGKTTLAHFLFNENPWDVLLLDDLSLTPERIHEFDPELHNRIIITDPELCGVDEVTIRRKCKQFFPNTDLQFKFIYFENNPEACLVNARRDPKPGGTEMAIKTLAKEYVIPYDADIRSVYVPS